MQTITTQNNKQQPRKYNKKQTQNHTTDNKHIQRNNRPTKQLQQHIQRQHNTTNTNTRRTSTQKPQTNTMNTNTHITQISIAHTTQQQHGNTHKQNKHNTTATRTRNITKQRTAKH